MSENDSQLSNAKKKEEEDKIKFALMTYYENYFEISNLWKVISKDNFDTREFGFQRLDIGFTRNKSFNEPAYLKEYLYTFPIGGAYIGSIYKNRLLPKDRYNEAVTIHNTEWVGRELIFDLDLDDYDLVRTCNCKGKSMYCSICWVLIQEAADIIDDTLRTDFGFKDLQWVYTGGRGLHCWVLDSQTLKLDQEQRSAIVEYMQLIHDPKGFQRVDIPGKSADLLTRRIYSKIGRKFILEETNKILEEEAGFGKTSLKNARERLEKSKLISDIIDSIPRGKHDIFLETLIKRHYPRIDHKVTIDIRRLIRMPGSIHFGTKNICKYIDDPVGFNPDDDATNLFDIVKEKM